VAAEIRAAKPSADVELIESHGGVFDVVAGDNLIFTKKQVGRFPQPGEIVKLLG
jgi:selenoprotein W-related protein